ncbi:MAG TPA: hypothetical protein VKT31_11625 [Solirubrobacteraceae bacterium]|nr:hypothetical protein [Solirubrobacteraceae bacterium]
MFRPLNVVATHESGALRRNDEFLADEQNRALIEKAIAPGFQPDSQYDLAFFGGKTIAAGTVVPIYTGPSGAWSQTDITAIDGALAEAFSDSNLEGVIAQYFSATTAITVAGSTQLTDPATTLQQSDVETLIQNSFAAGTLTGDPASTLFCLLLAPGTRLFASDGSDSYNGLGGYHGSVSASGAQSVYYSVGVYSETSGGVTNGIPAFDTPWKNVVATFYHEINEWRTDPDVENATGTSTSGVLGWYSQQYGEIGDIPITEAGSNLSEVFVEVPLASGSGTVPVQLMYSNHDHGPAPSTAAAPGSAAGG